MSIDQNIDTIWIRAYTPGGFQTGIMLPFMPAAELDKLLTENGYLCCEPGLEPGQEKETISRVVRRQKHNDDGTVTPIIDFYTDRGNFKYAHLYLNDADAIKQFEAQSGLKLASLKLYEGNTALDKEKNAQQFGQYSQQVASSFAMVRTPDGEWSPGMPKYRYGYFAEIALGTDDAPDGWATEDNLNTLVGMMTDTLGVELFTLGEFAKLAGIDKADDLSAWNSNYKTGKHAYEAALRAHAKIKAANLQPVPEEIEQPTLMEEAAAENPKSISPQAARFKSA